MSEIEERLLAEFARAKGVSITALKMSLATPPEVMAGIREDARRSWRHRHRMLLQGSESGRGAMDGLSLRLWLLRQDNG